MKKKNVALKKYIADKYGNTVKFLKKVNFPPHDLETALGKRDIFKGIGTGLSICRFLNIDAETLFCRNSVAIAGVNYHISRVNRVKNVKDIKDVKDINLLSLDYIIMQKYTGLGVNQQQKVLDFANSILESGDSPV